ncbi:hypothetical protein KPG66_07725 [Mycetohabitans sp. B2]|uniref:hypothetical protein n=1 Tax=Mycetohabitans sp. B2 TaxID=2841274 RepID=UPI001F4657CB|nr:hypothetical protein [Mycetohabitans sp. B2]MCF7695987.1 hypothetical protein [Mycetohabitans sp. B2]
MDIGTGEVISVLHRCPHSSEYLQFLRMIDASVPAEMDVLVHRGSISSNMGTLAACPSPAASTPLQLRLPAAAGASTNALRSGPTT